jgi:hypothetical protein
VVITYVVSVVNSYAAASEWVPVRPLIRLDLPTDGTVEAKTNESRQSFQHETRSKEQLTANKADRGDSGPSKKGFQLRSHQGNNAKCPPGHIEAHASRSTSTSA